MTNRDLGCILTGLLLLVVVISTIGWVAGMFVALGASILASLGFVAVHSAFSFIVGSFVILVGLSLFLRICWPLILLMFAGIVGFLALLFE